MDRAPNPPQRSARSDLLAGLQLVLRGDLGAQAALHETLQRATRSHSGEDRAFITDVLYGTLRNLRLIDAALDLHLRHAQRLPSNVQDALRAGTYEKCIRGTPAHAAVHAWVEEVGRGKHGGKLKGVVNAVLRKVTLEPLSAEARLGLPPGLAQVLHNALGEALPAAIAAMRSAAPLFVLRYREEALVMLEAEGATVTEGPLEHVSAIRPGRPLEQLQAFQTGAIQPQNPSSVAIVRHLNRAIEATGANTGRGLTGCRVLDVASGHGIKAAQLLQAGAAVTAVEIDARKIAIARRNLERLAPSLGGLAGSVKHLVHDARQPLPDEIHPFDAVLIDAPCSGTGTLRAHPEISWRWSESQSNTHAELQLAMCSQMAKHVRPGGVLVYAVCDLSLTEGPSVIRSFLDQNPHWRVLDLELAAGLDSLAAPIGAWILPTESGHDGFYCVALTRSAQQ